MSDHDPAPVSAAFPDVVLTDESVRTAPIRTDEQAALRSFTRSDPLGQFLLVRCRLPFSAVALICMTLAFILLIPLPIIFLQPGAHAPAPLAFLRSIDGFMMIVSWMIFLPAVWGFYAWQPAGIARLHARLSECLSNDSAAAERAALPSYYGHIALTLMALFLPVLEFYRFMTKQVFKSAGPWLYQSTVTLRVAFVLLACITYYMVTLLVLRQLVATVSINRIFRRERVPVRFLHPDKCGGLRFLGDHALGIAPLIIAAGLNLSLGWIRLIDTLPEMESSKLASMIAVSVVYVVGSIAFFVAPLSKAHQEMVLERDNWLNDIAAGFEQQQELVRQQMRSGRLDDTAVAKLESARKAADIGMSFPTWPLNVAAARKFTAALLSPVLPIGIAALRKVMHMG